MRTDSLPFIKNSASFTEILLRMSEGRLGMVIVGNFDKVEGIITDGDLRRALLQNPDSKQLTAVQMMTINPVFIDEDEYVNNAEKLMLNKKITTILVGSEKNRIIKGIFQIYS